MQISDGLKQILTPYWGSLILLPALIATVLSAIAVEPISLLLLCGSLGFVSFVLLLFTRTRQHWLIGVLTAAILTTIATTHWPLRVTYAAAKPQIAQVAAQVQAGNTVDRPFWVGSFRIAKAEVDKGVVCLWTDLHPNGRTGFVQQRQQDQQKFNTWSTLQLDSEWQLLAED
ncbi:MAG: hypothetical protein AAF329_13915 [Cyanobacteria bacterium P01_A01_bin.17]